MLYTYIYTYIHTYIEIHVCSHTHTHTTHTLTYMHTHMHTYIYRHTQYDSAHAHTRTLTHAKKYVVYSLDHQNGSLPRDIRLHQLGCYVHPQIACFAARSCTVPFPLPQKHNALCVAPSIPAILIRSEELSQSIPPPKRSRSKYCGSV